MSSSKPTKNGKAMSNTASKSAKKIEKQQEKKLRFGTLIFISFCLLVLVAFSALISRQASIYNTLRVDNNRYEAELARQLIIYDDLRYQMAHLDSDAYIERLARERLGWVRPNEFVFRRSS